MDVIKHRTYLVQAVSERFISAWCRAEHFPVIYNQLMPARRLLAFRNDLERANDFDCRLECEGESFVGPRDLSGKHALEVASTVAEDDENDLLLVPKAMDPSERPYALRAERCEVGELHLQRRKG